MLKREIKNLITTLYIFFKQLIVVRLFPPKPSHPFRSLQFSGMACDKILSDFMFSTILDVGSGGGHHSKLFASHGKQVTAVDFGSSIYYQKHSDLIHFYSGDYYGMEFEEKFDVVWASHVLEHQPDPNSFIKKLIHDCKENGHICITVPPMKHEIVGGHLSLWNAGLLLYHLCFAGIDCRGASILKYGYNISIIVQKRPIETYPELAYDSGDIDQFAPYLPEGLREGFNGNMDRLNW